MTGVCLLSPVQPDAGVHLAHVPYTATLTLYIWGLLHSSPDRDRHWSCSRIGITLTLPCAPCTQLCQQRGGGREAAAAGARPRGEAGGLRGHVHARAGGEGRAAGGGRRAWGRQGCTLPLKWANADAFQYATQLMGGQAAAEPVTIR